LATPDLFLTPVLPTPYSPTPPPAPPKTRTFPCIYMEAHSTNPGSQRAPREPMPAYSFKSQISNAFQLQTPEPGSRPMNPNSPHTKGRTPHLALTLLYGVRRQRRRFGCFVPFRPACGASLPDGCPSPSSAHRSSQENPSKTEKLWSNKRPLTSNTVQKRPEIGQYRPGTYPALPLFPACLHNIWYLASIHTTASSIHRAPYRPIAPSNSHAIAKPTHLS
jgi:hypothetical protein